MSAKTSSPVTRLIEVSDRIAAVIEGGDVATVASELDDERLLALMADAAQIKDAAELILAASSAVVARRSARDRGLDGLAQRKGHRTPTSLVQSITGQSRTDVGRAFQTGLDLAPPPPPVTDDSTSAAPAEPRWRALLRDATTAGRINSTQLQAIRAGLGEPPIDRYPDLEPDFLPSAWAEAVMLLLDEARRLPVEELRAAARIARDRLDPVGVTLRFDERYRARSFRMWIDEHGQHHARIAFDDEAAAWIQAMLSAALRPRRGPRFVESQQAARERAADIAADDRTNEQLQYDTVVAVLRTGAAADPDQAFGDRQPGVRLHVEATAVQCSNERGIMTVTGVGHVEDGGAALPGGVIEAQLCNAGALPITFDTAGRPLDVGREKRLFTRKQRIAIAARDGGCVWPSCTARVSWCEYHHIDHWWEDHGATDVDDGVPLCRNCHLRLHNQKWRISRERDPDTNRDTYWLHPPPDAHTGERTAPIRLVSKAPWRFRAA